MASKQKLSPKAAAAKAARDLAYAKTPDRRAKKAHSQREHRKNPGAKGMDYDHKEGRMKSVAQNRGNDGEGTRKEGKSNYAVPGSTSSPVHMRVRHKRADRKHPRA